MTYRNRIQLVRMIMSPAVHSCNIFYRIFEIVLPHRRIMRTDMECWDLHVFSKRDIIEGENRGEFSWKRWFHSNFLVFRSESWISENVLAIMESCTSGTYRHEWKNRKICSKWHAKNSRFVPFIQPVLGNKIFWGSYHDLESLFSATCDSVQIILSCKIHPSCLSLYSGIGVDSLPESRFRSAIFNSLIFIQR